MVFYQVSVGARTYRLEMEPTSKDLSKSAQADVSDHRGTDWRVRLDGRELSVNVSRGTADVLSLLIEGESFQVRREGGGETLRIFLRGEAYELSIRDLRSLAQPRISGTKDSGPQKLTATMPGRVVRLLARAGDRIGLGQGIAVVEAMKMQNEVRSPREGVLKELLVGEGANVNAGDVLAVVE